MGRETQHMVQCREHGGMFKHPVRRGRRAVRCAPGYLCDRAKPAQEMPRKVAVSKPVSRTGDALEQHYAASDRAQARKDIRRARRQKGTDNTTSRTQAKALEAKTLLESLDWQTSGKGFTDEHGWYRVHMTATRGQELLTMEFSDGHVVSTDYQLWAADKPNTNGKPQPNSKLPFDPDEVSDRELVRYLAGMSITWWNKLGAKEEHATLPSEGIEIRHRYDSTGEEPTPGQRMIQFTEHGGRGFRAFYLDQLLTIG